ncbi:MAG: DUF2283 domain-containing protein [Bacteroidales bacterium]|nr:DUF2283 domain-containing protein [Bacteroidales bacterium]
MLQVTTDPTADAIYIKLLDEPIEYTEELDDNRLIDRSLGSGKAVGVDLIFVSQGVNLKGLPEAEAIGKMLVGLGVEVKGS